MTHKASTHPVRANWLITTVIIVISSLLLLGCNAQEGPKIYRVGLLSGVDVFNSTLDGFKEGMAELGYTEGENIIYDFQAAGGDSAKMKEICQKFVDDGVDLIVTTTNAGALTARSVTKGTGIPVVFTIVLAPVETGVVENLRQPGGNVTGVRNPLEDFVGKRVEFLLQMAPDAKRLWVPYNPQYVTVETVLNQLRQVAPSLGLELVETPVASPEEVVAELEKRANADDVGFDAIIIMPDLTVQLPASWDAILAFANQHQIPISSNTLSQVEQGALFAYLSDNVESGQQAAPLADKILRGSAPAEIPVASAEPHLIVNFNVAQNLGLNIEQGLLAQASQIIR